MSYTTFKQLHTKRAPLLLANVWNAHSAQIAQEAGAKALGTSSHVMSNAMGLEDGNNLSFEQLLSLVKDIMKVATVPVSVDIESGYSTDPATIADYLKQLAALGVVGVNIEDSGMENGERVLCNAATFAAMLSQVCTLLKADKVELFLNIRTDTYVTKHANAVKETVKRGMMYKEAGADGLFVPLIEADEDIKEVATKTGLKLNVFATKDGPTYEAFKKVGVHRISSGDAAYAKIMKELESVFKGFVDNDLNSLF